MNNKEDITSEARDQSSGRSVFDVPLLRERRHRIASKTPAVEFLLAHVAEDFADRLALICRRFPLTLNLGCHNGLLSRRLAGHAGIEHLIDMDDVASLVELCEHSPIVASEEAMPFAPASLDLIVSALKLQLINDLPGVLLQARQALKPDGLFMAAVLGPDTLQELRAAFLAAEVEQLGGASPRVAPFIDVRQAGALLQRAGFALPVTDVDLLEVTYETPLQLVRELKAMGVSNPLAERLRRPMVRGLFVRALEIYQEQFALPDGRVRATFEIVTMTGWAPHESQQKPLRPGSATVSLADALKPRQRPPDEAPGKE